MTLLSKNQIKWLELQLIDCVVSIDKRDTPVITVGARREACLLQLQLNNYNFDFERRRAYSIKEGKRIYID